MLWPPQLKCNTSVFDVTPQNFTVFIKNTLDVSLRCVSVQIANEELIARHFSIFWPVRVYWLCSFFLIYEKILKMNEFIAAKISIKQRIQKYFLNKILKLIIGTRTRQKKKKSKEILLFFPSSHSAHFVLSLLILHVREMKQKNEQKQFYCYIFHLFSTSHSYQLAKFIK